MLLSLVSAVAYAAGAIMQERVAVHTPGRPCAPLRHGGWWFAMTLNGFGATLHVVALAYGPLSLVQPLGALTIVLALPMAAVFVRRQVWASAWRGAVMATVGLAGLLSLTGSADSSSLPGRERALLVLMTFGGLAMLFLAAHRVHTPVVRSVILATAAGMAFGAASVFTKTVAVDWTPRTATAEWPSLLAIAGLAGTRVLLSQASYRGAGLAAPLATVTVVNPVLAAAIGITLFGEHFRYGALGTALALSCGALAAGGSDSADDRTALRPTPHGVGFGARHHRGRRRKHRPSRHRSGHRDSTVRQRRRGCPAPRRPIRRYPSCPEAGRRADD